MTLRQYLDMASLITGGIAFLGALSLADAETLTGIVKQPEPPYLPAPASTVIVYEKQTNNPLAGPDITDNDGRYRYDIGSGKEVVVKASWRADLSSPGSTEKKVAQNPTEADVQLLPAKTAPPKDWMLMGEYGALSSGTAANILRSLRESGVPAASLYSFVFGARKKDPFVYKDLDTIELFTTLDPDRAVNAIQETENQYNIQATVPNYQQLKLKEAALTPTQHIELLGFIATSKEPEKSEDWYAAVEKAVPEHKEQVLKEDKLISETLFDSKREESGKKDD